MDQINISGPAGSGGSSFNAVGNKLHDPSALGAAMTPDEEQAWLYGGGTAAPVTSGTSEAIPNQTLKSGVAYRLTVTLPFPAPGVLNGPIQAALSLKGLKSVVVRNQGNDYIIVFVAP